MDKVEIALAVARMAGLGGDPRRGSIRGDYAVTLADEVIRLRKRVAELEIHLQTVGQTSVDAMLALADQVGYLASSGDDE